MVTKQLSKTFAEVLNNDLTKMSLILCMSIEIDDLLSCIEIEFGRTANYAKGHGSVFEQCM